MIHDGTGYSEQAVSNQDKIYRPIIITKSQNHMFIGQGYANNTLTWKDKGISWYHTFTGTAISDYAGAQLNNKNKTYYWVAIG